MDTGAFAGKTILVIDDDVALCVLLNAIFIRVRATVLLAHDGVDAQTELVRRPDLIVLDLRMPRRNGFEVLEELRVVYPDLLARTLVFTAIDKSVDALLGTVAVLHKPFDLETLIALLGSRLTAPVATLGPEWQQRLPSLRTPAAEVAAWKERDRTRGAIVRQPHTVQADERRVERNAGRSDAPKSKGFARLDPETLRTIAQKGGRAAHAKGTAHEFTSDEARIAGRKGGDAISRDRAHMAAIGREGGHSRGRARTGSGCPCPECQSDAPPVFPG
jgi:DNA-binding response OmpR family regulator